MELHLSILRGNLVMNIKQDQWWLIKQQIQLVNGHILVVVIS